jgi:hypothetical protein
MLFEDSHGDDARSTSSTGFPISLLLLVCAILSGCITPVARSVGGKGSSSGDTTGATSQNEPPKEVDLTRVRWVRIHGAGDESSPPILRLPVKGTPASTIGSSALTIAFDMECQGLPNLTLLLIHCDRDWKPTDNIFVQDILHQRSSDFDIQRSPIGVHGYDYSVSITFPQPGRSVQIDYSGNYLARIVDYYDNERIYAETRFLAVEPEAIVDMQVFPEFYASEQSEVVQHGLRVRVESEMPHDLFTTQVRSIALYRSGEWLHQIVASDESRMQERLPGDIWSEWNSYLGSKTIAQFSNIPSGNEHRLLDLTDLSLYPSTGAILTTPLSDLPRNGFTQYDNNGVALSRFVPLRDAEYVYFEFRLDLRGSPVRQDIFVVGTFNDWTPRPEWRLNYDRQTGFYTVRGPIKRALHEYEYLSGDWDEDAGVLRHADATLIEGNNTSTSQLFYGFVYYRETTGGGYDRIVGVGAGGTSGQ